jgi:hypothetical protein
VPDGKGSGHIKRDAFEAFFEQRKKLLGALAGFEFVQRHQLLFTVSVAVCSKEHMCYIQRPEPPIEKGYDSNYESANTPHCKRDQGYYSG